MSDMTITVLKGEEVDSVTLSDELCDKLMPDRTDEEQVRTIVPIIRNGLITLLELRLTQAAKDEVQSGMKRIY